MTARRTRYGSIAKEYSLTLAACVVLLATSAPSNAIAGTCIITFEDYPHWAAAHNRSDPAAFCRSFFAEYRSGTCRAVRHDWSKAQCDAFRRREAAYVAKKLPGFSHWSVIWRR